MKKLFSLISLIFSAIFIFACGNGTTGNNQATASNRMGNSNNTMTNSTGNTAVVQDNFWVTAAQGGMAEVELSKLALTKSQNAEVKNFAQMMVNDHSKANSDLKTLAATKKVVLPTEMDSSHKSKVEDLSKLSGADFDKRYIDTMVADHEKTVELFEDQAKDDSDSELKIFAANLLPKLKGHLEMIKKIQSSKK